MCGFFGILGLKNINKDDIMKCLNAITHRGPDDKGIWIDEKDDICLSHNRLAIVDLSPQGHQPMTSSNKRYIIVFNGEIYNYTTIKEDITSNFNFNNWVGKSDTEVFLESICLFGIEKTVAKLSGMFAFAIWDTQTKTLTLGRDRMGEKPLYYGWLDNEFIFGSDLSSFSVHKSFKKDIDRNALALFMRHSYIPAPHTIYKNINKLIPGSLLKISLKNKVPDIIKFWDESIHIENGNLVQFDGDSFSAINKLENLLIDSVKNKLIGDVPIGAFLSGGIDSSLIVAIMQSQTKKAVNTFTIGFEDVKFNEAQHAKAVANHLGTNHTEYYVSEKEIIDLVPQLSTVYSEPFADPSQLPTILVSKLAKKSVTVALTGDGGDELFCGYRTYSKAKKLEEIRASIPKDIKVLFSNIASCDFTQNIFRTLEKFSYSSINPNFVPFAQKILKISDLFQQDSRENLYRNLISRWDNPDNVVLFSNEPTTNFTHKNPILSNLDFIEYMMAVDTLTYLPDNNLCKVDRASMFSSLETRVPLLDHKIVEFAWSLPLNLKLHNGITKWPLRQVLYKYIPVDLIERPKMGFSVPLSTWLRGPLREWAEDLLNENKLKEEGFLNHKVIIKKWEEHLSGKYNWQYEIWNVLMFQSWLRNNILISNA
jgi:asparagine synthase (glutamine-hydrolysing)